MTWDYTTEYNKLLDKLDQDTRPWRPFGLLPEDCTRVYLKCFSKAEDKTVYDVGQYEKFSDYWNSHYGENGEWVTEFGNYEQIIGWKPVEEEE